MSKSLYSLILNDDVVALVDRLASYNGLSRSSMVEKLLADAVEYETPEIRATSIFDEIQRIINESRNMRYLPQSSQYMASIVSALDYRYNPAIKYSFELFPQSDHLGQLRVTLRTQNEILINYITDFYRYYIYLEKTYYNPNCIHLFDGMKFTRLFDFPTTQITTKELAEKLTKYVNDFDKLINIYFNNLQNQNLALAKVKEEFLIEKQGEIVI